MGPRRKRLLYVQQFIFEPTTSTLTGITEVVDLKLELDDLLVHRASSCWTAQFDFNVQHAVNGSSPTPDRNGHRKLDCARAEFDGIDRIAVQAKRIERTIIGKERR